MSTEGLIENLTGLWRLIRMAAYPAHLAGITPQQYWLLRHLEHQCPVSIGVLADVLGITSSSTTSACKRLEQAGLVTRTRQTADERVVEVDLTFRAAPNLRTCGSASEMWWGVFVVALDPREQATLELLLARVLAAGRAQMAGDLCHGAHGTHGAHGVGRHPHTGASRDDAQNMPASDVGTQGSTHGTTDVRGGAGA